MKTYSISEHFDNTGEITAFSDPAREFATWQECAANPGNGWDGDEFTLADFQDYIDGLKQKKASGCFCGLRGLEIEMTIEQALGASHSGACDDDVLALSRVPEIAAQLDAIGADDIRSALEEYGAWTDEELQDDEQNRQRALWSAACDIRENNRELA